MRTCQACARVSVIFPVKSASSSIRFNILLPIKGSVNQTFGQIFLKILLFYCYKYIPVLFLLTLMLLVPNLANTKWCKNLKKWLKPWHMGTHLSKSYPMNTNMTGCRWFPKIFGSLQVLWTKVVAALEGLTHLIFTAHSHQMECCNFEEISIT